MRARRCVATSRTPKKGTQFRLERGSRIELVLWGQGAMLTDGYVRPGPAKKM